MDQAQFASIIARLDKLEELITDLRIAEARTGVLVVGLEAERAARVKSLAVGSGVGAALGVALGGVAKLLGF